MIDYSYFRPATLLSVSVHLLRAREDIELQHLWVALALQVLELYIVRIEVSFGFNYF